MTCRKRQAAEMFCKAGPHKYAVADFMIVDNHTTWAIMKPWMTSAALLGRLDKPTMAWVDRQKAGS
jgi:hypothetical protein